MLVRSSLLLLMLVTILLMCLLILCLLVRLAPTAFVNVQADHSISASFAADALVGLLVDGQFDYSHSSEYLRLNGATQDWYESRGTLASALTLDQSDVAGNTGKKAALKTYSRYID